jgi:restriction system protein
MPRYWIIAPVEADPSDVFDKAWEFDLSHDIISIGWASLGDTSKMSREQLEEAVAAAYPDRPPASKKYIARTIWTFEHEIAIGDWVIARRGLKVREAVGQVSQPAFYEPGKNPVLDHPRFLGVSWQKPSHKKDFLTSVFIQNTIQQVTEDAFQKLLEHPVTGPETPETSGGVEEDRIEIVLEKYLQELMVGNFDAIFKGELTIFKDADGKRGQQYPAGDVGFIDILAFEPKSNSFVVIELKRGHTSDQVIGQTLRYMGWVKEELCDTGQAVRGLIICGEPDTKLSYALKMTKDIDVRYYDLSFKLKEVA